jgi:hypothetical protein
VLDAGADGAVFWVPQKFASEKPVRLASSFDEFLTLFTRCALNMPVLLRSSGVRGWG